MFNDFKNSHYKSSKQKLDKLKDIFDRLTLPSLDGLIEQEASISSKVTGITGGTTGPGEPGGPGGPGEPPPPPPPPPGEPPIIVEPYPGGTAVVVIHAHNPEGIEIGGLGYATSCSVGNSPTLESNHFLAQTISAGIHPTYATFNGMTVDLGNVNYLINTKTILTFTFPRINGPAISFSGSESRGRRYEGSWDYDAIPTSPFGGTVGIDWPGNTYAIGGGSISYNCTPALFTYDQYAYATGGYFPDVDNRYLNVITVWGDRGRPPLNPGTARIPVDIPARTDFTTWFSQYNCVGLYPYIGLPALPGQMNPYYIHGGQAGYGQGGMPASINWTEVEVFLGYVGSRTQAQVGHTATLHYEGGNIGGLKLSSTPYDLHGNGW